MRRILLILMMMNVMSPFTYLKANNPDYVGDLNAEAQRICFDSEGIYTYPLNPNGYGFDEADVLNPNIDFDLKDGDDYNLIAPTWFYIEPTTPLGFSIKVTKTITSGEGTKIDYICFRVPKSADPLALTYATTGADNAISYDYEYNNEGYFTIDFPADPNEEYNYVLVTFNMWENYGDASPTGYYNFELVESDIPTSLSTQTIVVNGLTSMVYGCPGEEYTIALTDPTINANPSGTKYHYVVRLNNATSGTIIAEEESYEHSFSFTPEMQDGNFVNNLYAYVTATYDPGYLCESVVLTEKSGTKQVRIYKKPTADFTYTASCKTVTFTSTSTNINTGTSAPYPYYTWIIKDKDGNVLHTVSGSVANNPEITTLEYTFEECIEYDVTLQVAHSSSKNNNNNQCYDEITKTITIPCIDASFTVNPNPAGRDETVTFTINNYNENYLYSWDFGNGNIASGGPSVTTTYANTGTYNATLTVKDGDCEESSTEQVIISDCDHSAKFTIEPNPVCHGEYFVCKVTEPVDGAIYKWYYQSSLQSEGVNEDEFSATEFGNIGFANITLEMTVDGCTVSKTVYVQVLPKPIVTLETSGDICEGDDNKVIFTATSEDATEYIWTVTKDGEAVTVTDTDNIIEFTEAGLYEVSVIAKSGEGCESYPSEIKTAQIFFCQPEEPVATLTASASTCFGGTVTFTAEGGNEYIWTVNGEPYNDETDNVIEFTEVGAYNVSVVAKSGDGCESDPSEIESAEIYAKPVATLTASESVCFGGTVTFTAGGGNEYIWTVTKDGEAVTVTDTDNIIEFTEVGVYDVSVIAKSDDLASDPSETLTATIFDYLDADAGGDTTIFYNTVATLEAVIPAGVDINNFVFRWEPAELVVNPDDPITETVMLTETTTFTLTVTNRYFNDCSSSDDVRVEVMLASPMEFVDLGLSVKWATQNVGASSPEDGGEYYLCTQLSALQESVEGRLPTKEEMYELKDLCEWKWITQNGVNGYLVTSKTNGNSIFIPAAGYYYHRDVFRNNEVGNYWTSASSDSVNYYLFITSKHHSVDWNKIDYGRNVRFVTD